MTDEEAVLAALTYFDYFNYPLTAEEVHYWLPQRVSFIRVKKVLVKLVEKGRLHQKEQFYFLPGQNPVQQRQKHQQFSSTKMALLQKRLSFLKKTGIIFLGISGSLALADAGSDDDIDLLVVAPAGRLWWSRLWLTVLTTLLGWRRRPQETHPADKLCFNIFLDEQHLALKKARQNIYTAHELLQLRPVYDAGGIYQQLLAANRWAEKFLPQAYADRLEKSQGREKDSVRWFPTVLENICKNLQLAYMEKRGEEEINAGQLFFHPEDKQREVLENYQQYL